MPGWLVLGLEVLQELELEALPAPLDRGDDDDEDDDDVEEEDSDDVLETLPAPFARGDDQSILEFYPITIVVHNSTGALVVLAVPVLAPDLEVQALDLDPALVLAPTRAMAPPALLETETGDQPLDLPPPPPLLGAGAFLGPVWQEGFWEGLQVEPEEAWQAGSAMLSNLTGHLTHIHQLPHVPTFAGMGQTSISHSQSQRKALEATFSAAKSLVLRWGKIPWPSP